MTNKKQQPARLGRYANLNSSYKKKPSKKVRRKKGVWGWFKSLSTKKKVLLISTPIVLFLVLTPLITYWMLVNDISDQERLMNRNNTGIALTDINGEVFYSIGKAEHRNLVKLDDISKYTKEALIATEDKDFYKHGGFNLFSIARAAFTRVGGGSTITQQLAKNTLLTDDRNLLRKYQELFMSIAIEQHYSKDEILTMYLNSVYYGENAFGIEEAARVYFNKSPKDLDLAESAMLIGILPAPSAYSPISGTMEYAKQRQNTVLTRMVTNGYITEEQKTAALAQELVYGEGAKSENSIAPHFAEMVMNELSEKYGYENVMRSGMQVKTTLDLKTQQVLVDNVNNRIGYINNMGGTNASAVAIDPKTGEIRGLVGSADYKNEKWGNVNMVTTARQPGSSFKPIYYAYALSDGTITPSTILHDVQTNFPGWTTPPQNADRKFRGDVSVRKALNWSLNIPSIEVMQEYTIEKSVTAANSLGISTVDKEKEYGLSLSLGSQETRLDEMTNAYAAFANGGQQYKNTIIKSIDDKFGKSIFTSKEEPKQAISQEGAYLISNILSDNQTRSIMFGGALTVYGHSVAVKTGTTNDSRDAWTIGYTPSLAIGVWVGNNDNEAMYSGGSDMAGPIWRGSMQQLLADKPNEVFAVPDGVVQRLTCTNGGLASEVGRNTYNEYYIAGALPTVACEVQPITIEVCNLKNNKVETINEKDFKEDSYSKNLDDCKKKDEEVEVCELSTGEVIEIKESEYNPTKHSKDIDNCEPPETQTQGTSPSSSRSYRRG